MEPTTWSRFFAALALALTAPFSTAGAADVASSFDMGRGAFVNAIVTGGGELSLAIVLDDRGNATAPAPGTGVEPDYRACVSVVIEQAIVGGCGPVRLDSYIADPLLNAGRIKFSVPATDVYGDAAGDLTLDLELTGDAHPQQPSLLIDRPRPSLDGFDVYGFATTTRPCHATGIVTSDGLGAVEIEEIETAYPNLMFQDASGFLSVTQ